MLEKKKRENPFALQSITLSAKLSTVSVPRVGACIGDVLFSLQVLQSSGSPSGVLWNPPGECVLSPRPNGAKYRWTWRPVYPPCFHPHSHNKALVSDRSVLERLLIQMVNFLNYFSCIFARAHRVHYSILYVIMILGHRNGWFSSHFSWVILSSVKI